jgi:hypothetical protein
MNSVALKLVIYLILKCCYRYYLEANSIAGCRAITHARYLFMEATSWMLGEGGVETVRKDSEEM